VSTRRTRSRLPCSLFICSRQMTVLQVDTRHLPDRQICTHSPLAHDFGNQRFRECSGTCLQDNRAVGNSRLAHREVLSVSCKQVPEHSPWHCLNRQPAHASADHQIDSHRCTPVVSRSSPLTCHWPPPASSLSGFDTDPVHSSGPR